MWPEVAKSRAEKVRFGAMAMAMAMAMAKADDAKAEANVFV